MIRVEYHPEANQELAAAALFYHQQALGLGGEFLDEVEHAESFLVQFPAAGRSLRGDTRRISLRRFPYALIYQARGAFGFVCWLIAFAVAFVIFPLRESSRTPFESIMPVTATIAVVCLGVTYFRRVARAFVREGVLLGLLWLAMSVVIDAPLMLVGGPTKMSVTAYAGDIGLTYLIMPAVTVGLGAVLAAHSGAAAGRSDAV